MKHLFGIKRSLFLSLVVVISLSFTVFTLSAADSQSFQNLAEETEIKHFDGSQSISVYDPDFEKHIAQMEQEGASSDLVEQITSQFVVSEMGSIIYPDDYAGMYYDDDGILHILTTSSHPSFLSDQLNSDNAQIEQVKYSINQLNSFIDQLCETSVPIDGIGINEEKNAIVIALTDQNTLPMGQALNEVTHIPLNEIENEYFIRNSADTDDGLIPVIFERTDPVDPESELWPGDKVGNSGTTIGAVGYFSGRQAIVTCGHGYRQGQTVYYGWNSSSRIGEIQYHRTALIKQPTPISHLSV